MKTANFDAVLASQPLNATAGRVVSQKGEHYEPLAKWLTHAHSDTPLPMVPVAAVDDNQRKILSEIVGRRFGRLVVLGILKDPERGKTRPAAYVVRCLCGRYETRRYRTLIRYRGSGDGEDRCSACWGLNKIRWKYANHGDRPIEDFTSRGKRY